MTAFDEDTDRLYDDVCEAARLGGAVLLDNFGQRKEISYKGSIDPVTNVDIAAEKAIVDFIRSCRPSHDIITEESNLSLGGSQYRWIIDPLDGTVNYAHDHPMAAVSVGLEVNGGMQYGAVYNPMHGEFFRAAKGGGAFMNDLPINVSNVDTLNRALLATGFPYSIRHDPYNNLEHFSHMAKKAQALRRDGSAALNLCYTAMGRYDGYWELIISPWDIAAGSLIVAEAGGLVTDVSGGPFSVYGRQVLATNGRIHREVAGELMTVGVRAPRV
jgi:myo-inositol-1(or 4)-monophosphatase